MLKKIANDRASMKIKDLLLIALLAMTFIYILYERMESKYEKGENHPETNESSTYK